MTFYGRPANSGYLETSFKGPTGFIIIILYGYGILLRSCESGEKS
jgi:hypothetical protein